ncbi:hypothetical protein Poli38472_008796 [Pythium oligandrum]|uniref:CCHC-type domain-containing protein n=1 Tax=Pythium oligandrum TaxID=41045 RepID=A0A8K1C491_PYTOL|nr:hypothetical protein Poli38472_008796 [Pythium oligandrum]|eukprot:TMW56148.1 hypothetical protein Poli38472_008796 [Pythium oligandrum]
MKGMALRRVLTRVASARAPVAAVQAVGGSKSALRVLVATETRTFSSRGRGDDEEELNGKINGELSPLERLLQHSQQFRDEVGLDELPSDVADEILGEHDEGEHREVDEEEEASFDEEDHEASWEHVEDELDAREEDHAEFVAELRKPRGPRAQRKQRFTRSRDLRATGGLEASVRRRLLRESEIDYEHGLSHLDERRAKEHIYTQLLERDYDHDRICHNCGERGHVARNCLLPTICSNCGDIGHRRHECPHHVYTPDELARIERQRKAKKVTPETAELDPEVRRHLELRSIKSRHERMKQAFDDELDEYLNHQENLQKKRKQRRGSQSEDN